MSMFCALVERAERIWKMRLVTTVLGGKRGGGWIRMEEPTMCSSQNSHVFVFQEGEYGGHWEDFGERLTLTFVREGLCG